MLKKFGVVVLLVLLSASAYALTMTKADFGTMLPGDKVVKKTLVGSDIRDNTYVISVEGDIADWLTVSPREIYVPAQYAGELTLILEVPDDADYGEYSGLVVATGQKVIGSGEDTGVGFMLQVKAPYSVVVGSARTKAVEEPIESLSIIGLEAKPSMAKPGDIVRIMVTVVNSGTLPTTASVNVQIKQDDKLIDSMTDSIGLDVAEEHIFTFFWVTDELEEAVYRVTAHATSGRKPISAGPINIVLSKEEASEPSSVHAGILLVIVLLVLVLAIIAYKYLKLRKRVTRVN